VTSVSWVIGAGGLLGSAVIRSLAKQNIGMFPSPVIGWNGPQTVRDLESGLAGLLRAAGSRSWQIYWCAGAGVTDSDPAKLETELSVFTSFLAAIARLSESTLSRGSIIFSSSAGAVYGGSTGAPFTELSDVQPLGRYGAVKLRAEEVLQQLSEQTGISIFVGRLANLYGPGQSLNKRQGLVSMLCFSTVTRIPISIFVPLDTLRDYIFVDDCARMLVECAQRLTSRSFPHRQHLKVLCSGRAVTVGAVLGQFRQVSGSRPLVIMGASRAAVLQGRDLRLRSGYWPDLDLAPQTTFSAGIRRTIDQMRLEWLQPGRLAGARN